MNKEDILRKLKQYKLKNAQKYGLVSVAIFGSVARDTSGENSDIDICVESQTPTPLNIVHMKTDLEDIFSKKVDIVRMRNSMNPFLKKRIESEAIYV